MSAPVGLDAYLALAATLAGLGLYVTIARRTVAGILEGAQLLFGAAGIELVAFHHFQVAPGAALSSGVALATLVPVLAVAQAVVAGAVLVRLGRSRS